MATISKGFSFGATETVTNAKLHTLVDGASISGISNSDIAADAAIASSKINFTLSDYVTIAGEQTITGAKTFSNTTTFSTALANTNIAAITQANKVAGSSFYALASCVSGAGKLPQANLPTIDEILPAQGSASGKFLTSDGANSSWDDLSPVVENVYDYSTSGTTSTDRTSGIKVACGRRSIGVGGSETVTGLPFTSATSYYVVATGETEDKTVWVSRDSASQITLNCSVACDTHWIAIGT